MYVHANIYIYIYICTLRGNVDPSEFSKCSAPSPKALLKHAITNPLIPSYDWFDPKPLFP